MPQEQLHNQIVVISALIHDGYCNIFIAYFCPFAGAKLTSYKIEGVEQQGITHSHANFSSVRERMVLFNVSACLSAPAPSPASFVVVISARYLLVPFVTRDARRVSLLGGTRHACVLLRAPSLNASASHGSPRGMCLMK